MKGSRMERAGVAVKRETKWCDLEGSLSPLGRRHSACAAMGQDDEVHCLRCCLSVSGQSLFCLSCMDS